MKKILFLLIVAIVTTSCYEETSIPIEGDFTTSFVDGDESVPVTLKIDNPITGADTYVWEFEGGNPGTSSQKDPGEILYTVQGTYTITLTATNRDGESKKIKKTVVIKDRVGPGFSYQVIQSNYSPLEVAITNTTLGEGLTFTWNFEGGNPAYFTGATPPNVVFTTPGDHTISLTVSNGFESQTQTQTVSVAPYLVSSFSYQPVFDDDDFQAAVIINFENQSISATHYAWVFEGGTPATSAAENPVVTFAQAGQHQITLTASNGKTSQSYSRSITILPDTNLRVFNDVRIGINSAHTAAVGAMFSTATREVYKANEITAQNSALIDIAFQGLNSNFSYNKFISPNQVSNYGFLALAHPQNTVFINSQELCNCGLNFTVAQFDAMTDDSPLQPLQITYTAAGAKEFDTYPRIVLFKTQDGRKGAIKVKNMVHNGAGSYIVCDIKVQKQ